MGKLRILWFLVLVGGMCQVLSLACRLWTPPNLDFLILAGSYTRFSITPAVYGPHHFQIFLFWLGPLPKRHQHQAPFAQYFVQSPTAKQFLHLFPNN